MKRFGLRPTLWLGSLLGLLLSATTLAHAEWFTLTGRVNGASASDYIQVDPEAISVDGDLRTMPVRVSRMAERRNKDGLPFRSFEGHARIDCVTGSAFYTDATFYPQTHFKGIPIAQQVFSADDVRPMLFRAFEGDYTQRVVRAACRARGVAHSPN